MANAPSAEACSALIEYWAKEYKRLFNRPSSKASFMKGQQIPPTEMRKYIDQYKKWYESPVSQEDTKAKLSVLRRIAEAWQLNVDTINKLIKYMESTLAMFAVMVIVGCQSGLYKVSTSEDDKTIDESVRYYEVERRDNSFAVDFMKDNGASPDGILYDEERMPIEITEGSSEKVPDKPGWSGVLWMFSLGIFPMCQSEYMTQDITVKSPIGEKSGSYRVDAKRWAGWIPLFVGYPGSADERDSDAKLPNRRLEGIGKDRLVKNLVGEFSFKDYVSFAKSKNGERKAEISRIKDVSEKVDGLLAKNKFDDAATLIECESKSRSATQDCDEKSWTDMRERVAVAHQAHDKKHAQTLIATGKYEDAISFCDSKNSLSEEVNSELKTDAVKAAVKELKDAGRLIAFLKLIKDVGMRDDVVMKLKSMNSLSKLTAEQLTGIANTSERDDVVLAVIEVINDKSALDSFLDKKRSANVLKAILEKIADADAVRNKIWTGGNEAELCMYASVFGSDDECLKLIKAYPNLLSDAVIKELKAKISQEKARSAIEELQTNRLASEISTLKLDAAIARVKAIDDESIRSILLGKLAEKSIQQQSLGSWNHHNISGLETAATIAAEVNNQNVTAAIVAQIYETIESYEERCRESWSMSWGNEDEAQAKKVTDRFAAKLSNSVKEKILLQNKKGWKRIVGSISPESALKLLKTNRLKYISLEVELAKKINANDISFEMYANARSDDLKKVLFELMPESVKDQAQAKAKENAKKLFEKADAASSKTFALKGFYLGMPISDAKELVSYYLPKSKVVVTKNNDIEIDVTHTKEFDTTPMFFCRADKEGKVYLFNFDKRFLKQWFNYDVQSYREWAIAYGREFNVDFRAKSVKGKRDLGDVWLRVSQEVYQYRNNMRGYVISYFGEKDVVDPNEESNFNLFDINEATMRRLGKVEGVRAWVKNGWENGDGAREGTLRVSILKEE